jgi:hypothetical protein
MLINILIRTNFRPTAFARCIKSVKDQTYKNIRIIVSYDNHNALKYIPEDIEKVKVIRGEGKYFYDEYCNQTKGFSYQRVTLCFWMMMIFCQVLILSKRFFRFCLPILG